MSPKKSKLSLLLVLSFCFAGALRAAEPAHLKELTEIKISLSDAQSFYDAMLEFRELAAHEERDPHHRRSQPPPRKHEEHEDIATKIRSLKPEDVAVERQRNG